MLSPIPDSLQRLSPNMALTNCCFSNLESDSKALTICCFSNVESDSRFLAETQPQQGINKLLLLEFSNLASLRQTLANLSI